MKPEKSFEYFSAYYEGTLEPVLKDQLEHLLAEDSSVAEQFASFVDSIVSLNALSTSRPDAPADLHEIIMRKVDQNAYELKKSQSRFSFANLKVAWFGLAASAALVCAFVALRPNTNTASGFGAGVVPTSGIQHTNDQLIVSNIKSELTITLKSARAENVKVTDLDSSLLVKEYSLKPNQVLRAKIYSEIQDSSLLKIESVTGKDEIILAIPSRVASQKLSGEGTIVEMAKAFAGRYQVPVQLMMPDLTKTVRWNFESKNLDLAKFELEPIHFEQKEGIVRLR